MIQLVPIDCVGCICYIYHMPDSEKNTSLNVRVVPEELIRKAKSSAALQGKTLREWIIEAIQEKLRRSK
jgi:predicted HicB family RNase H-like nuclease